MTIFGEVDGSVIVGVCVRSCDGVVSGVGLELVDLPGFEGGAWSTCEAFDVALSFGFVAARLLWFAFVVLSGRFIELQF